MNHKTNFYRAVLLIVILAGGLRLFAARSLYGDDDEAIYMKRAVDYANFLRSGQYSMLAYYDQTYEHPALYKILYGVVLLTRRPLDAFHTNQVPRDRPVSVGDAATWMMADRYLSVTFGTLAVAVLAWVNPIAGLFLGVDTLSVKYTSEVYLEALPLLTSILCAVTYLCWFGRITGEPAASRRDYLWLVASAVFLGLTAASKYIYCVVGIAIALHFVLALIQRQVSWRFLPYLAGWGIAALIVFFAFDPYLWPDPVGRLSQSIQYNIDYSQSEHVVNSQYPFWQPFRWLSAFSSFYNLGPRSAFIFDLDTPIFLLAIIGLPRLFVKRRFYFYWLIVAIMFLLLWNTKWPQYDLIALAPLSVSSAEGLVTSWHLIQKFLMPSESTA